jgi:hypothetical protein
LHARDEVLAEREQLVRGRRERGQGQPLAGLEDQLGARAVRMAVEVLDEAVGGVAELAQMDRVRVGIVFGTRGRAG